MASHLEDCTECRARLDAYRGLFAAEASLQGDGIDAASERVWAKLSARRETFTRRPVLWRRSVSLPLPAAAAAAAAIIFLFAVALRYAAFRPLENDQPLITENTLKGGTPAPVSSMAEVLQYAGLEEGGGFVIIRLPESKQFMSSGTPTYVKAANYPRSPGGAAPR